MNVVLIIPTGIGCEIGGHAGDANPVAKLLGSCCDKLILHPNVVNASDINEMPENALYVEGSILDRFLEDKIGLKEIKQNKILVVANSPITKETINAVNAARTTIGIDVKILELEKPLKMIAKMENGIATGSVDGWQYLCQQVKSYDFDALAIHTPIIVDKDTALNYFKSGGVNPWGGIEAQTSKLIAKELEKPVAHAPLENMKIEDQTKIFDMEIDPRIASEIISNCYLHCVLKGLNKAPRISCDGRDLWVNDIDFLVSPYGCWSKPHNACSKKNIPIIIVRENECVLDECTLKYKPIYVENYWEAVGYIMSKKSGINPRSVRRPLKQIKILKED